MVHGILKRGLINFFEPGIWTLASLRGSLESSLKGLALFWNLEVNEQHQEESADPSEVRKPSVFSFFFFLPLPQQRIKENQENSIMPLRGRIT